MKQICYALAKALKINKMFWNFPYSYRPLYPYAHICGFFFFAQTIAWKAVKLDVEKSFQTKTPQKPKLSLSFRWHQLWISIFYMHAWFLIIYYFQYIRRLSNLFCEPVHKIDCTITCSFKFILFSSHCNGHSTAKWNNVFRM